MKKAFGYIVAVIMMLGLVACEAEENYISVPFEEINCACVLKPDKLTPVVVYDKARFEELFRGAGPSVDFGSQFVIAVCGPSTEKRTVIKIVEIQNKEQNLYVKYTIETGEDLSYKILPHSTVAVDRGYKDCVVAFYDVTGMK